MTDAAFDILKGIPMPLKLVQRRASKNWYLRGTVCGQNVFESTGTSDKTFAEPIRIQREKELLDESVFGRKRRMPLVEAAVRHLEHGGEKKHVRPIIDHMGRMPIAAIDQATADRFAREIYPDVKVSTLVRQFYTPLKAILNYAADLGYCEKPRIKSPIVPKNNETRWITPDEAERLINACAEHLRVIVIFLIYTGARLSEALYIKWREVHLDSDPPHVQFLKTKNDEPRSVPLHPRVVEALRALPRLDERVFHTDKGNPYAKKEDGGGQIKTAFKAACRKAGIDGFTPHGCRHTFATWHQLANHDPLGLMTLGGWKTESMVRRYTHINVSHLADSVAALPWQPDPKNPVTKIGSRGRVR